MEKRNEKKGLDKTKFIRRAADSIPFFMVSIAFFVNLFSGIILGIELVTIMIRSVVAVILFSGVGYFIGKTLKAIAETLEKKGENENNTKSIIDFASEPDDSDLLKEMRMTEEGFNEANPAEFTGNTK